MIKISRRLFSKLVVLTGLTVILGSLRNWFQIEPSQLPSTQSTLEAYLDILIPPDQTPGAVALGVADKLLKKAGTEAPYQVLITSGCQWLNRQANQEGAENFSVLSEESKEKIVRIAETSPSGTVENSFFTTTRNDAFVYYYAHPEALEFLSYSGPPQPMGFPDHTLPPTSKLIPGDRPYEKA